VSKITVIIGPPCGGKSTLVRSNRESDDVIVDYDSIAMALGASISHNSTGSIRDVALGMRYRAIDLILKGIEHPAWVIHTRPSPDLIARYHQAGAHFELCDPGKDVCLQRATDDERGGEVESVINDWYDNPPNFEVSEESNYYRGTRMNVNGPENYEARTMQGTVEIRKRDDGGSTIRGLAAVFNSLSENLGGFREQIKPGAFDKTNMKDVRGLFNHDTNFVLGRTLSKTVRLKQTKVGLEYEIDLPDTQTIRDLVLAPIKRGDIDQSSFGFIIGPGNDSWDEDSEGRLVRTINAIDELFDVSPVTFPAYAEATVGVRSRDLFIAEQIGIAEAAQAEIDERKNRSAMIENLERRAVMPG